MVSHIFPKSLNCSLGKKETVIHTHTHTQKKRGKERGREKEREREGKSEGGKERNYLSPSNTAYALKIYSREHLPS